MEKTTLQQKLFEIQSMDLEFKKSTFNKFLGSYYCNLRDFWQVLKPICIEKKLLVTHNVDLWILTTTVLDVESNEKATSSIELVGKTPQWMGADITYFKRYNLWCIFNVIVDEDIDWNKSKAKTEAKEDWKKSFNKKRFEDLKIYATTNNKASVMQQVLKIQSEYNIDKSIEEEFILFVKNLK